MLKQRTIQSILIVALAATSLIVLALLAAMVVFRPPSSYAHGRVIVNDVTFNVELAVTSNQQQTGLMYRNELPERQGMLFIFDEPTVRQFWMKNTFIPLDIIFIDADRRIINIRTMPAQTRQTCQSDRPALYVLEIAANAAKRFGINPGMTVELKLPKTKNGRP
jgi:hypothetical protein